jgi:hypothetical protein
VLLEMDRVLRADGRLVLVVPERSRTFDAPRPATPAAHVLDEYERGVSSVDDQHVREFCEAIWAQPPIHPEPVREWHDPARLDAQRLELHRRRSIHAHCWTAEEFVALLAVLVARGLARWRLEWQYLPEDLAGSIEFGLALSRTPEPGAQACAGLVRDWARGLVGVPGREAQRLVGLERAIARDLAGAAGASVAALTERLAAVAAERDALRSELRAILGSRSFRAARALAALRRRLRGFASRD